MTQSDDAAGEEERNCYSNAARLLVSQMIAAEQEQTITAAGQVTYTDKMQIWEWSATKIY